MMKKGAYPTPLILKEYNSPLIEKTRLLHLERKFPDNRKKSLENLLRAFSFRFFNYTIIQNTPTNIYVINTF